MSVVEARSGVEAYLERLRRALGKETPGAAELAREIEAHIFERIQREGGDEVGRILREMGEPESLAADYRADAPFRRAARSWSPLVVLTATGRWAVKGVMGTLVFLVAVAGYGAAAVCLVATLLKPALPGKIGLWVAPGPTAVLGYWSGAPDTELYGLSLGRYSLVVLGTAGPTPGPIREVLGAWFYPVAWFSGVLLFVATTLAVRFALARFGPRARWRAA